MLRLAAALSLPSAPLAAAATPRRRVAARADSPTQLAAVVLQLRQQPAAARARKKPRLPATPQQEGADANADADADADASPKPRRACVRCGVQKTPQWRAGPDGPKTLCNACGVAEVKRSAAHASRTTQLPQPAQQQPAS